MVQSLVGNLDPHVAMPKTNQTKNNAIYHTDRLEKKNCMLISTDAGKALDKFNHHDKNSQKTRNKRNFNLIVSLHKSLQLKTYYLMQERVDCIF